jgi:purine-cytosine permease-like protein
MIKFIRLLFYHIYIYYYKAEKGGKAITKFSTFSVFLVIFFFVIISIYTLICQLYDSSYTFLPRKSYFFVFIIIAIIIAYYLYREGFYDFNEYYDYNKKYYYYFFIIVIFTLCLFIYTGKTSRERIFKQRELHKEHIENKK